MYPPRQRGDPQAPSSSKHTSALSKDTTASGIADSTISNGESLRLSEFPQPPASVPTTPIHSGFGTPSPTRRTFTKPTAPLMPQRRKELLPVPATTGPSGTTHPSDSTLTAASLHAESGGHAVSPYDWHDGASSINNGIDDRLLSTSFITSLLREKSDGQRNHRTSCGSDAFSGLSEITYPPVVSHTHRELPPDRPPPVLPLTRVPTQQLHSGNLPPSSYTVIANTSNRVSGDSDTLYSPRDHHGTSLARAVSLSRRLDLPGGTVVGIAPAVIHNISPNRPISYSDSKIPPTSLDTETAFIMDRTPRATTLTPQIRTSVHSVKSMVPSFISRLSINRPLHRLIARTGTKPLPPVPLVPYISNATEIEHRRSEEIKTLPDLVHRADALEGLLEKGYHPHQSLGMYVAAHKGRGFQSGSDDTEIRAMAVTGSPSNIGVRDYSQHTRSSRPDSPVNASSPPKKRRFLTLFGGFLTAVLVVLGIAIGVAVGRKKKAVVCPTGFSGAACNLSRSHSLVCFHTSLSLIAFSQTQHASVHLHRRDNVVA